MLHHLGAACRDARKTAALRQIDIATAAGTTHATISRFETGKRWPVDPDRILAAYAVELGIDPWDLLQSALDAWRG